MLPRSALTPFETTLTIAGPTTLSETTVTVDGPDQAEDHQGTTYDISYYIYFEAADNGLWKIVQY